MNVFTRQIVRLISGLLASVTAIVFYIHPIFAVWLG
jgi:hypothetical protein